MIINAMMTTSSVLYLLTLGFSGSFGILKPSIIIEVSQNISYEKLTYYKSEL